MKRLALAAVLALGAVLVTPAAAFADAPSIGFVEPSTTAPFASNWVLEVSVQSGGFPVTGSQGAVDVVVAGIAGTFATLPLQSDGRAYLSQPLNQPLLAAGDHQLTAIFVPAAGSPFSGATSTAATLTITPLGLDAVVNASADPSVATVPVITASLAGEYLSAVGSAPAGIWSFEVTGPGATSAVFSTRRVQEPFDTEPLTVDVEGSLRASTDYTVAWRFEPVSEIAGGLEFTSEGTTTFRTPDATLVTTLAAPISWPLWAWITAAVVVLALLATAIVLLVRVVSRSPRTPRAPRASVLVGEDLELASDDEVRALLAPADAAKPADDDAPRA